MLGKGEEYGASIHIEDNMSSGENLDPGQKRVVGSVVQMADSGLGVLDDGKNASDRR